MNVTEVSAEGLKHELKITLPAAEIAAKVDAKIAEVKDQIKLPGFRPGKVPEQVVKQRFGDSLLNEVFQEVLQNAMQTTLEERELRPAMQPDLDFGEGFTGPKEGEDVEFTIKLETLPDVPEHDFSTVTLEKQVAEVSDEEVQKRLQQLADGQRSFEDRDEGAAAETNDQVNIDFVGTVDGEAFEGGSAEGVNLVLGSNSFIPGFEDQLVGVKVGDEPEVKVTFPEDYQAEHLAGNDAVFACKVNAVQSPMDTVIDDEFAKNFGMENLEELTGRLKEQVEGEFGSFSREKLKRDLLDQLDGAMKFEVPEGLLDAEFHQIWHQFEHQMEHESKTFDDMEKSEDEYKEEYKTIAERRVRLGLALAEIGRKANIEVTQEELTQAIFQQARNFPGQEQQIFEFYSKDPQAAAQLRAPLIEEKVVDYVLELATVTEKTVTEEELKAPLDDDEAI
ncbi:MAG: trigger factor [Alphaproteobacteria bacterium]